MQSVMSYIDSFDKKFFRGVDFIMIKGCHNLDRRFSCNINAMIIKNCLIWVAGIGLKENDVARWRIILVDGEGY